MGRPKINEEKRMSETFTFRMTKVERQVLDQGAQMDRSQLGPFMVRSALERTRKLKKENGITEN